MQNTEKPTILVVDDDEGGRYATARLIRTEGFPVIEAATGGETLKQAAKGPGLVVLDVNLPDLDGFEVCRQLKADPVTSHIPVLHLSATFLNNESKVQGLNMGADGYLTQPVEPLVLLATINALLRTKRAEAALRMSEEKLKSIFRTAPVGIGMVVNRVFMEVNQRFCDLTGYGREELIGRSARLIYPSEEEYERVGLEKYAQFAHSDVGEVETRFKRRDGAIIDVLLRSTPRDRADLSDGVIFTALDISAQKRAEEALGLHAKRLQSLLDLHALADAPREQLLDFVLEASLSTMQSEVAFIGMIDESESTMTIHRWSKDAMARCAIDDKPIIYPVSQAGSWGECIRRRQAVLVNDYQAPHPGKKGLPEGHVPIRRFLAVPVMDKGRVALAAAVANKAKDYTKDDVKAFNSLLAKMWEIFKRREAEEAFQTLVNCAPIGIHFVQDGRFKMVNPGLEKITAYSQEELIGRDTLDYVVPEYRDEVRQNAVKMLKGQSHLPYEFPIFTKGGETRWVLEKLSSTVYQGRRAALGYFMDITEHKNLEGQFLQAQKMEAVGRLAGGVAHDFNNMLNVILGYSDLMSQKLSQHDPLVRYLAEIRKAADRAASLTSQLLAFSRKQIMQPQVLDLNVTFAEMESMIARLIGEDIEIALALDPDLGMVKADPGHIEQIIMNLAVNARDAMPQGGRLTLETANVYLDESYVQKHAFASPGPYVMLAVSDNGQGMDAATLARIFEPFFTTKEEGRGTGLGMSTVYGIVKQNGGRVEVYSEIGQGTTFKVYLPQVEEAASAVAAVKPLAQEALYGSETVLVVEDEDALRPLICSFLARYGYKVLEARHGGEALLLCERHPGPIHLLVTDVVMPQMSGRELSNRLALLRPDLKVLYMSGYTENAVVNQGVLDPAVSFIQKPFRLNFLMETIRRILDEATE